MPRKAIKYDLIENEGKRNIVLNKRVEGLKKKLNDLSILCGVDAAMVIHKPGENNAVIWPQRQNFDEILHRFVNCSESDRVKKMVAHENLLVQRLNEERNNLEKLRRRVHMKELQVQGEIKLEQLDLAQLNSVASFAEEMLKFLGKREKDLSAPAS